MDLTETVTLKPTPDRPRGGKFGRSVRVRLPVELEDVLPITCRLLGVSLSGLLRGGLEATLARMVTASVEIMRDPNAPAPQKLRLWRFLRESQKAVLVRQRPEMAEAFRRAEALTRGWKMPIAQKDKRLIAAVQRLDSLGDDPEVTAPA